MEITRVVTVQNGLVYHSGTKYSLFNYTSSHAYYSDTEKSKGQISRTFDFNVQIFFWLED